MLTSTLLPFAIALGFALLHSLWIGTVLFVLVRALLPLLGDPAVRHHLAYGALLATFTGFTFSFYYVYDPAPVCENLLAGLSPGEIALALLAENEPRGWLEAVRLQLPAIAPWLAACYLFGLVPALMLLLRDQRRGQRLGSEGITDLPAGWAPRLAEMLSEHPATRRVRCYLSDRAGEVMTLGFWNPVIVFPVALVNQLTPEMAHTILLHEIAHLRHYDHWLNYPQQILRTFFFFHPAVHALCRLIDREREHRCDDWVAARCDDRRTYAAALVTVARSAHLPANQLAMSATKTPFSARIQRLFLGDDRRKEGKFAFFTLLAFLLCVGQMGYNQLGADAGAADCLEEQSIRSAKPESPDAERRSPPRTKPDDKFLATITAPAPSPCPDRLRAKDLPCVTAPEPPASTHPRALESYDRALRKYDIIRSADTYDKAITPIWNKDPMLSETGEQADRPTPCRQRISCAPQAPASPVETERPGRRAKKRTCVTTGPVFSVIPTREAATLKCKKLAYFIDGKRTEAEDLNLIDPEAITSVEVVRNTAALKALGVGCFDGALIIAFKGGIAPTPARLPRSGAGVAG